MKKLAFLCMLMMSSTIYSDWYISLDNRTSKDILVKFDYSIKRGEDKIEYSPDTQHIALANRLSSFPITDDTHTCWIHITYPNGKTDQIKAGIPYSGSGRNFIIKEQDGRYTVEDYK